MRLFRAVAFLIAALMSGRMAADEIAAADLQIQGVGLRVVNVSVATGLNIPAAVQTEFGGKQNDDAPVLEGLLAVGELSGPGIDVPIRLETAPGHKFQVPGLQREGIYFLQNVRLMKGDDFLQPATPAVATITVSNLLQTSVKVRQLTAEEIRARGITVDARNYDVFEYTFSFLVDGVAVEIPFPVIIDPRTHEVRQVPEVVPWNLPPVDRILPPRWFPPDILTFEMAPPPEEEPATRDDPQKRGTTGRITIPAALVIPNNLAVLHQFFAVTLMVTNGAPDGSTVTLDDITAVIKPPAQLRTVKSIPSVAFGQPVPIVDASTGVTFLIAQARGEAEWTMEGLQTGTHTVEVEVKATYKSPGQVDFPLKGTARASVVVHDPRFNVNFSHPDVVRKDIEYSTYSFITNMSPALQNIRVANGLPACSESPGANVCRVDGTPAYHDLTIPAGEMRSIEYKLRPGITGNVFATAGSVEGDAVTAQVALHMGVSESGIPLSPATLIMPYYARFVGQPMVSANLQLLGLGYSLATAPMSAALAKHPRIIKTDVFRRATDIARAGQRVFLGEAMRDSLAHMTLDLLGNEVELREWDDLRRAEKSGRTGAASIARELETASAADASLDELAARFATATAWRAPYLVAVSSAGRLSVRDVASNARMEVASEAASGWVRQLPWGEIDTFRNGELAVVGRWSADYEVTVTPAVDGPFTLDLIFPAAAQGSVLRARFSAGGVTGKPLKVLVTRGAGALELRDALGGVAAIATITSVAPAPLTILGARQDLKLDAGGHKVSILWSRPVSVTGDLLTRLAAQVVLDRDNVHYDGPRPMSAAALQEGGRVANVTFDHALSKNATYTMTVGSLTDPIGGAPVTFPGAVVPLIDNEAPGGILYGHVLKGDNTPIGDAEVRLLLEGLAGPPQYDNSRASDGAFLFEFVPRDIDNGLPGTYTLEAVTPDLKSTSLEGAVRLPGRVHLVNLVFLGRGSAEGTVRYDNGEVVANARVVVGSTMFDQFRTTETDANGRYAVGDLPVGPLTFSATDEDGNVTFAASEIRTPGQVLVQDLSIYRKPFPGTGTIRGIVRRSDTGSNVPYAQVGVWSQGYGLVDGFADASGRFEFRKVPIGFITVLAAEWSVSRISTAIDFDLGANEVRDVTLTLDVKPAEELVVIEGDVIRENPLYPGDTSRYEKVAGAVVKLEKGQAVTADANGHYVFPSVPVSFSLKKITAYDPLTTRSVTETIPQLDPTKVNAVPLFIATANGYGTGTIRVRVLDAAGYPVTGLRVIEPAYPPFVPKELISKPDGVYLLENVPVGGIARIWAISSGGEYGDQAVTGTTKVEFNGHIASLNLRLPGQGTVRVKLAADIDVIGDVKIVYPAWEEADMNLAPKEITRSTSENGVAGYATFTGIPALQDFTVSSQHPVYGYAAQTSRVGFDGDVRSITLSLDKLSTVRGVIYAIDGKTPVPGAAVRIEDGRQNQGTFTSLPDGSYEFRNVPAGVNFRVIADVTQDGTYRTGVASGTTPATGGPVNGLSVVLRTQGSIEGRIVYAGFKVFDPQNPANNVIDPTPNDLSDNAPVPLANFALRELEFPYRSFGTLSDPIAADVLGRFNINNVFTGSLRITAIDPANQETRGTWTGAITQEGEKITALVGIGAEGFGPVVARVLDPNAQNAPVPNAEVTLTRATYPYAKFDLTSTDANGIARFEQVPVGSSYKVSAYSKSLGKSGASAAFPVVNVTGASVDVVLEFSGRVDGTLTDPEASGRGVPGAPVTLTSESFQTRASTDTAGAFVFQGVREGAFKLEAKDTESNRRASATRNLTQADPNPHVALELEPTETLYVSVYLPNDSGGNSNILAPVVNLDVRQRYDDFKRNLQGNSFQMPGLFENESYSIAVKELGGEQRTINATNSFPAGSAGSPLALVLPAYGTVEVHVAQGSSPAVNAKVMVSGSSKQVTAYTDATGTAIANGIPLGPVYVQVSTVDGAFSGSASGTLSSQTTPAVVTVSLGAYAGLTGLVEAEAGGASAGTRVVAQWSTRILEGFTDATGRFTFQGIPTGSSVSLTYLGPDDVTVGARQTVPITAADASKVVEAPKVKLDATPPQVASFFPADNATNVSPDSTIRITFTERIGASYVSAAYLQLLPADSATPVATTYASVPNANGTFTVTLTPPAPPAGQNFPLKSNTLYRIVVSSEIRDLTGNRIPAARGASFITSDYAEPKVLKVVPSPATAIQANTTFEFRFNEPIDPAPWQPGGAARLHFYKISQFGEAGTILAEKSGNAYVGPTGLSLFFAPAEPIDQESYYRIVFSGVRDLQGNPLGTQTFHFFSYDVVKPFATILSPVPDGYSLVSGVEYVPGIELRNGSSAGTPATDIARVDYFRVDGSTQTYAFTATASPWTYRFVAPDAPAGGAAFTLRAIATDLSGNTGDPADLTWQVKPNAPPQNVTVTLTPSSAIYPGNRASAAVTFEDEGTQATVQIEAAAAHADGTQYTSSQVRTVTRQKVNDPWPVASFDYDLPGTLAQGTRVTFSATVTDIRGLKGNGSSGLDLLVDTVAPEILSLSPPAQSRYNIGQKFQIAATVRDLETGVASVTFSFDNQTITVTRPSSKVTTLGDHSWSFTSGDITVPAKNVDTTIAITATARDYNGNVVSRSTEIVYVGVNDPTVPRGAWLCPIDKAVYPAGRTMPVRLQVRATDDIAVTAVKFTVPGAADPIAATRVGTSDVYETQATLTFPPAGQTLTLNATISDADPTHDVTLPVVLDAVAIDVEYTGTKAVTTAEDVAEVANKSVLVRGTLGRFVPHVPLTLKNLIVLEGALVDTLQTTTTTERKLDLTVTDRLYVDCASSVDVTAKGYLGGWGANYDGSGSNADSRGRTIGNTVTGGATTFSSASHAGLGGFDSTGVPNEPYGSITNPTDLGAGGGGAANGTAGAAGGGAIKLQGGIFAIAGAVRADGGSRFGSAHPGAGGSVNLRAGQILVSPAGRVTANGGDDDALNNNSRGAGGGRVAIVASDRIELESAGVQVQARGGRNGTTEEAASYLDGGAGTIYVRRPGQVAGELFVSSLDERFPNSVHLTRPTPLSGTLQFEKVTLGKRALVRADAPIDIGGVIDSKAAASIDASAVLVLNGEVPTLQATTTPAAGAALIQTTSLAASYTAASAAGIGSVRFTFTPIAADRVDAFGSYPKTQAPAAVNLTVPADAAPGAATLTLVATDRAGRSTQTAPLAYTIVANTAPVVDAFDALPAAIYPGRTVTATLTAHDDVKVTKLTLTKTIGTGTPSSTVNTPNVPSVTTSFVIPVDINTPGGQTLTIDLAVEDGYPGRPATRETRVVSILRDTVAPEVTIGAPAADALYNEGTGNTVQVRASITDADVGVKEAFAQIGTSAPVAMTKSGSEYVASVPVPNVDGTEIVTRTLTVTGRDYEGNAASKAVTIRIQPINDPNAPVVRWSCPTGGATFPAGVNARLLVYALGNNVGNTANGVQKVEFFIDDSPTAIAAAAVSGSPSYYEATWAIPATAAPGSTIAIRAVATNASGLSEQASTGLTIVVADRTITADTTIAASDASYDGKVVVVQSGTTTIAGEHTFARLIVLDGAKVTHPATDTTTIQRLSVTATSGIFVSCNGSIDVSARGFSGSVAGYGRTWPNTTTGGSYNGAGGSHGGRGAAHDNWGDSAAAYGSIDDPNTPGGSGGYYSNGNCYPCNAGGGIARIKAPAVIVDGKVLANGQYSSSGTGAGGSIRVEADTLLGGGEIHADGAASYWAGAGGGRVALHYQSLGMDRTRITAAGGLHNGNASRTATAGTVYLRQNDASGAKLADELVIGNLDRDSTRATPLAPLGSGTVTAVSGGVVTLSNAVPEWIEGSTIEFLDTTGAVRSTYEIASRTATSVTVRLAPGEASANAAAGDGYRGVWRFGQVTMQTRGAVEADALRTPAITSAANTLARLGELRSDALVLRGGRIEVNRLLAATTLSLKDGAVLTHSPTTATTIYTLNVEVSGAFSVDAASSVDVSARGFTGSSNGYGRTWPNTNVNGSYNGAGGSHGGRGAAHDNWGDSAATYGSVLDPGTPGGSGGYYSNGTCNPCSSGGGVARIKAGTFQLDGRILSNGELTSQRGAGAGGSIRVDAGAITGLGEIHADGAPTYWAAGGGGRVALYYQSLTLDPLKITAAGGLHNGNSTRTGAAGTVYLRRVDAAGSKISDELVIDNLDRPSSRPTTLPIAGSGTVTAVNGAVLTLSNPVPEWIEGATVEFLDATGAVASSYEIASRTNSTITVKLPAGQTTPNVVAGNGYRGLWPFSQVTARRLGTLDMGAVRTPVITTSSASFVRFEELYADDVLLRGAVETRKLVARSLALQNGAVLSHPATTASTIYSLEIDVDGPLTIDATSSIDVSGRGLNGSTNGYGRTWPNTPNGSFNGAGGSHGGRGGMHDSWGDSAPTYGSYADPNTPGGSGGYYSNGTCSPCNAGGGIARVRARTLALEGKILANGELTSQRGAGAGGSIRVDADTITGLGEIHADGAPTWWAAGGGGRVAVYYGSLGLDRARITAAGGLHNGNATRTGAAGTVYLKQTSQPSGDLIIDNAGRPTNRLTTLVSVGYRSVTETGADFVRDAAAQFSGPDHLRSIRAFVNHDRTKTWPIVANDATTLRLDVTGAGFTAQSGQSLRGVYKLDSLTLRNATLDVMDALEVAAAPDKDAASTIRGANDAPPRVTTSLISLQSTPTGSAVAGSPGAVVDTDAPVTVYATNTATGNVYTAIVSPADGSFSVPVQGSAGDPITLKVRDGNFYWFESPVIQVGTLPLSTPVPSQIDKSTWSVDAPFLARTLSRDGSIMGVSSMPSASSDKLVLLSVSDPAYPNPLRTVATANGAVRDFILRDGWAYIGGDRFLTLDLTNPAALPVASSGSNLCGAETAVLVIDGMAYTAMTDCYSDGYVILHDVSTPGAPRYFRHQAMSQGQGVVYTDLLALGTDYLVALSPSRGATGHDVVVIDRRNIYDLKRVADIDIPGFDAFRGTIVGTTLYAVSQTTARFVVVDLSTPSAPVLIGSVPLPAVAGGVYVIGQNAFVACAASGLATIDLTNPAAPVVVGLTPVGGNSFDVNVAGDYAYVANETGLALVPAQFPPQIDTSRISMSLVGSMVTVTGAPRSVSGRMPITVEVANVTTGAKISGLAVRTDGSFSAQLTASPNDAMTVKVTDANGRFNGPLSIGRAPFGAEWKVLPISTTATDVNFSARNIATSGNHLVVASNVQDSGSDKLVIYDVTDRANPILKRVVPSTVGNVRDIYIHGDRLIIGGDRLATLDLATPASSVVLATGTNNCGSEAVLEVAGGYLFSAMGDCYTDAYVMVYELATGAAARYVSIKAMAASGHAITGLAALGTDYLVAANTHQNDVLVIDRRDLSDLKKVVEFDVPNFTASRVKVVGSRAYLTGTDGTVAVVDLTVPSAPVVVGSGTVRTQGWARSLDALGTMGAVADGTAGVSFLDLSAAGLPAILGSQSIGGTAWECAFNGSTLYIANQVGVAVIDSLGTPPLIDRDRIVSSSDGAGTVTVTGAAKAVLGLGPITLELRNAATGQSQQVTVASDGSFRAIVAGTAGQPLTVKATDALSRVSGPLSIGTVPFGSETTHVAIPNTMTDSTFISRNLAVDGNDLVVADYGGSDKLVLFDVSVPGKPVYERTLPSTIGAVRDLATYAGWLLIAADRVATLNLADPAAVPVLASGTNNCGTEVGLTVAGGYLFTAMADCYTDGYVNVYDISTPSAPRWISTQPVGGGSSNAFTDLALLGPNYLVGVSPTLHDVTIIDRRDIHGLKFVRHFDIANFEAWQAKVVGNLLYIAGIEDGLAIVDLTDPTAPVLLSTVPALGSAMSVDVAGATLAVANGMSGVSFVDATSPASPFVAGSHPLPGAAWEVALSRGAMYAVTESGLAAVSNVATPPMLEQSLLTIVPSAATATVGGGAQAITGIAPLTVVVKNDATAQTSPAVAVAADGSFTATVAAVPGQPLSITATDSAGRSSTRSLGATYGAITTQRANPTVAGDASFRARSIVTNGTKTLVSTGMAFGGFATSNRLLVFGADPAAAPQVVTTGIASIQDLEIQSGYLYVAGDRLGAIDLADPTFATKLATGPNQCGSDATITTTGRYAFTAMNDCYDDGYVMVYDLVNPAIPAQLSVQAVGGLNFTTWRKVVGYSTSHVIALTADKEGGVERDVVVIDRTNPAALVKVTELGIPGFDPIDALVDGTTLYVTGGAAGVAIVDLSNPAQPQLKGRVATAGVARGLALSGPNELAVADASAGITFVNVTDKANPVITGTQQLGGNIVAVDVAGRNIYVAAENQVHTIQRP